MRKRVFGLACFAVVAGAADGAFANGSGGTAEFSNLEGMLTGWSQGYLGRSLSIAMLILGLGVGIMRQSIMGAIAGLGAAVAFSYGPSIIGTILGAVV